MKKIVMYNHASTENHGCEAILRTTTEIIDKQYSDIQYTVTSNLPDIDDANMNSYQKKYDFMLMDNLFKLIGEKKRIFVLGAFSQIFHAIPFNSIIFKKFYQKVKEADVCISVGGDTYSYGKSAALTTVDKYVRKRCKKTVLWGCSINPEMLKGKEYAYKLWGLRRFSLITVRESLTYEALRALGLDNVRLYPDPAFTLPVESTSEPMFDNENDIVGINISPLIRSFESGNDITLKCYVELVRHILETTNHNIAFISHVRSAASDDSDAARAVMEHYPDEKRIKLFENGNAMQMKGYISRCRYFVVARTHASIAAYSTGVPTLVVGYSVKARGIAKDIFGTDEGYVIPVQSLSEEDSLVRAYEELVSKEDEIRKTLSEVMPGYIERSWKAGEELKKLIEG
ncbi:MAG: polysaccharide pyruvyl transferase family protein [Ruminococcaceae bacterium]|nr:polysaccharide pyruvyl transferase family protein [Oscillospiraceae bacterium]